MHFTLFDWAVVVIAIETIWLMFQPRKNHRDALLDVFRDTILWAVVVDTLDSDWRKGILLAIGAIVPMIISLRRAAEAQKKTKEDKQPKPGSTEEIRGWIDIVDRFDQDGIGVVFGLKGLWAKIVSLLTAAAVILGGFGAFIQGIEAGHSFLCSIHWIK